MSPVPSRILALASLFAAPAFAQDAPYQSSLVGRFDQGASYADVWAEGTTAFVARFGSNRTDLVDLSNPSNPTLLSTFITPAPDAGASAQDVRGDGNGLMFVGLESSSGNGAVIVDVRNPASPQLLTQVDVEPGSYEPIHNLFYDSGWLYLCNSSDNTVAIVDMRTYDINNPVPTITTWAYRLTNVGSAFVHDITVVNGRLYCAAWNSLEVYDVSNLGVSAPVKIGSTPDQSCHAVWATDDNQFVVTGAERGGGAWRLYEAIPNGPNIDLVQRDSYAVGPNRAFSAHNCVVDGDRVYLSYYQAGVHALQIDRASKSWELISSYDTSSSGTSGFSGCWGVYPYLGADMILGSDMQLGVHVIDMDVVSFTFPNGKPASATPGVGATVTVQPVADVDPLDPGSVTLHAAVDGGPDQPVVMAAVGGGQFQASLPAVPCGSRIDWWVTAANGSGQTYESPAGAPVSVNTVHAATSMDVALADDFSSDQGWTVQDQSVTTGTWTRVVPNVTSGQTEFDVPEDAGALCYVTGQGSAGGSDGTQDMDGGPTYLQSPVLDFSAGNGRVSYSKWLYNDDVDNDSLTVEVSGNGGATWVLVDTFSGEVGGWTRESFVVGDHVAPSANVRVRFGVSDQPNDSITEGAIDDVLVEVFGCGPPTGLVLSVDPLVRGQVANFTATGGAPGEPAIFLLGLAGTGTGQCFFGGTFCLDVLDPFLILGNAQFDGLLQATLPILVPPGAPLIPTWSQAVVAAGAGSVKSNVVPATIQ